MKLKEKVIGLNYYHNDGHDLDMVKEAGFNWLRRYVAFPWKDAMYGELTEEYIRLRKVIQVAHEKGFKVMVTTPGLRDFNKDFLGPVGSEEFYENVMKTCAWYVNDLKRMVGPLWCIGNELDHFDQGHGLDIVAETAFWSCEGIVSADPDALCGINLSRVWDQGLEFADMVYREGHKFGFIGDDQYFGSWQRPGIEKWYDAIDILYERYKLPIVAVEWGYSSSGETKPAPPEGTIMKPGYTSVCHVFGWHYEVEGGHTEEVQAEYLRQGIELFAKHPHVLGQFLFKWSDPKTCWACGRVGCPAECFWGIVDTNLNPKPAYYSVKKAIKEYYG
ncbi:MAG: hypothetical protein ACOX1R_08960 [Caldicoprobacterales bacterium]